jgi:transcriptional regulator with PAS, ATPase and Fis domain
MKTLLGHAWPGNVRELDHAVEGAVLWPPAPPSAPPTSASHPPTARRSSRR